MLPEQPEIPVSPARPAWRQWLENPWLQAGLLAFVMFMGALYYQFVPGLVDTPEGSRWHARAVGLSDCDGYYHTKMGWLYGTGEVQAAGADFHWTRHTIWNGDFSDKDFLFHLYLTPFTHALADGPGDVEGLLLAGKLGIAVLIALVALVLFGCLRVLKVRHAWLYTLCMAAVGGSYIVFRLNMCRSYVASMALALAGWVALAKRHRTGALLLAAVYTLTYTASHLLLAMQVARTLVDLVLGGRNGMTRLAELKANGWMIAAVAGGIMLGCAIHPQPLETLNHWWVQNVVVLAYSHKTTLAPVVDSLMEIVGSSTRIAVGAELQLGRELEPPSAYALAMSTPVVFFAPMVLPLLALLLGAKPSRETLQAGAVAVCWELAYAMNQRFIEYATPFMVLAIGLWITEIMACPAWLAWRERRPVASRALPAAVAGIGLVASVVIWVGAAIAYRATHRGTVEMAGRWLHEHSEAHGKAVFHCRWDDFPYLFFYASECDYLNGLDPTFMLVKDPQKYELWYDLSRGRRTELLEHARDDFGCDYILFRRSSSEYAYNRLAEEARAGRLHVCIRAADDEWTLYRIAE